MTLYVFHDTLQRKTAEKCMEGGKLHCLTGYALIEYDVVTGFARLKECRVNGILHSVEGLPSRVSYYPGSDQVSCEEWHANGKLSNFPHAALIRYDAESGEWIEQKHYRQNVLHRLLGAAHIVRKFCPEVDAFRVTTISCFVNGIAHSSHGAQRINFNIVRPTYKNVFHGKPFSNRYNVVYAALMHPKTAPALQETYEVNVSADIRGTECPICLKEFSHKIFKMEDTFKRGAGVLLQCMKCKQAFHLRCVETWDASCAESGAPFTCSICRCTTAKVPMKVTALALKG